MVYPYICHYQHSSCTVCNCSGSLKPKCLNYTLQTLNMSSFIICTRATHGMQKVDHSCFFSRNYNDGYYYIRAEKRSWKGAGNFTCITLFAQWYGWFCRTFRQNFQNTETEYKNRKKANVPIRARFVSSQTITLELLLNPYCLHRVLCSKTITEIPWLLTEVK